MAYSPPDSSVHGILQARILEWVAMPSSGDLPNPGIKPVSPALAGGFFTAEPPGSPFHLSLTQSLIHTTNNMTVQHIFRIHHIICKKLIVLKGNTLSQY